MLEDSLLEGTPMTDTATGAPLPTVAPKGFFTRVIGVFTSPRETFVDIAERPSFLGAIILSLLLIVVPSAGLSMTARGKEMAIDQAYRGMQATERMLGRPLPDQVYEQMEEGVRRQRFPIGQVVGQVVIVPIVFAIEAGILFVVFTSIMGGDRTFKQVLAVVAFASLIGAAGALFAFPIMYAKAAYSSPTTMAVFVPFLDARSFVATFLGWIDLFRLWWILNLAIGLAVLYKKRTTPIAISLLGVYGVFAVVATLISYALSSGA